MAACLQIWKKHVAPAPKAELADSRFLANPKCKCCRGTGYLWTGNKKICYCVWYAVFRSCFDMWLTIQREPRSHSSISFDRLSSGRSRGFTYGRKREEYTADFELVSRRTLADSPASLAIFELHFLSGAGWRECCRALRIDRGSFFHEVYRIEARLGKVFATLQPYALYPVKEYFGGTRLEAAGKAIRKEQVF